MQLWLDVALVDDHGKVHGRIRRRVSERAAFIGPRIAEEMSLGVVGDFKQSVEVLRVKELRRGELADEARMAGQQIADFLQDREGWHGLDRQESAEQSLNSEEK